MACLQNVVLVVLMLTFWALVVWLVGATAYYLGETRAVFKDWLRSRGPALQRAVRILLAFGIATLAFPQHSHVKPFPLSFK
jgi:hypothetical protein